MAPQAPLATPVAYKILKLHRFFPVLIKSTRSFCWLLKFSRQDCLVSVPTDPIDL